MSDKPRCDFYYVLMSEDGEYMVYDPESLSTNHWSISQVLCTASMWFSEEKAKELRDRDKINAKVYKVHSPIIECCEVDLNELIADVGNEIKVKAKVDGIMKKW